MVSPKKRRVGDDTPDRSSSPRKRRSITQPSPRKGKVTVEAPECSLDINSWGVLIKKCLTKRPHPTMFEMSMNLSYFRKIIANATGVVTIPVEFYANTPVVVARLSQAAAKVLVGISAIRKNRNEFEKAVIIFFPPEKKAEVWVTS
ncbi:hypothetical protein F5B22DRAFT_645553 [Xylaria bambusicola]|uniref:uncharacterized protein n=1 Tax=Xylaria bambusicola TaxID=326684 RepID=UPI00200773CF|nr:uncharacterized protein F5B22DRAFT_645553 [Xylaria bambusicola]KAI0517848.1 hypothetical protein F5B22DRAFT_645553 [Xylaria bambusicola]